MIQKVEEAAKLSHDKTFGRASNELLMDYDEFEREEDYKAAFKDGAAWQKEQHAGTSKDMAEALQAYLKAQKKMLNDWAEGDNAVKARLWTNLHHCEIAAEAALSKALD